MGDSPWKWSCHGNQAFILYFPEKVTKQCALDVGQCAEIWTVGEGQQHICQNQVWGQLISCISFPSTLSITSSAGMSVGYLFSRARLQYIGAMELSDTGRRLKASVLWPSSFKQCSQPGLNPYVGCFMNIQYGNSLWTWIKGLASKFIKTVIQRARGGLGRGHYQMSIFFRREMRKRVFRVSLTGLV